MKKKASVFRRLPILLAMIMLLLSCMGCGERYKIEEGFARSFTPPQILMGMRSKTDTFAKDDVTFELYYSFYELGDDSPYGPYNLAVEDDSQEYYYLDDPQIIFCLYVYNIQDKNKQDKDFGYLSEVSDYKALEYYNFVKEIPHEKAFSDEYGYSHSYWTGVTYNHSEAITIPQEVLTAEADGKGTFFIKIIAFQTIPKTQGNSYRFTYSGLMLFEYEMIDNRTIRLTKVDFMW